MHGYRGKYWGWVMPLPKPRRIKGTEWPPALKLSGRTETPKALSGMGYGEGCSSGIRGKPRPETHLKATGRSFLHLFAEIFRGGSRSSFFWGGGNCPLPKRRTASVFAVLKWWLLQQRKVKPVSGNGIVIMVLCENLYVGLRHSMSRKL